MPLQTPTPDPLEGYSGLSLFARTFAALPNPPRPYDPDDLQHSHDFLKSMPLQSPNKLIEQAKAIVDSSSELMDLDMPRSDAEVMENPRERRPALGRKRPRFSLKPNSSQPSVIIEPSLDIDKLKDPEEFFMAFERAENAKREIKKQIGAVLMDLDQNIQSVAARPRRPGISRRSVKYRHCYSTVMSPVESLKEEICSPLCGSQQEKSDPNVELEEEFTGLVTNVENKVNDLLDHLLTSNYDGDEAVSLLQEHLQIKPIDLEKICLPDLQDIRRIDLKASTENLPKPRNSLSDIQSLMKGTSKRTPKQQAESSVHHLASPTPPRSPLASISLLKKQMLQSNVLSDPFSTDDIDRSPMRNASPIESISKQSDQVDTEKEPSLSQNDDRRTLKRQAESSALHLVSPTPRSPLASMSLQKKQLLQSDPQSGPFSTDNIDQSPGINAPPIETFSKQSSQVDAEKEPNMSPLLRSPLLEANQTATVNASSEFDRGDFAGLFDKFINDNARRFDSGINVVSSGSQADLENNSLSRPEIDADGPTIKPNEFGGREQDMPQKAVVSPQIQLNVEGPTVDNLDAIQRASDESNPAMDEDRAMDRSSRPAESDQVLHEKGKTKPRPHNEREMKALSRRQSLAGSGTMFDLEGRRRSTRIRSRPLEFWKGERFLYGRIHSSLATVIGIKYESPGKVDGGNPTLKVKSFVSDEYKDMVEQAARF
ncbi:centromere protein C isoform X2 [Durio zibethinus]|uniref:Centromere protein C isoform X2 n=1 Tax=Durio zibethinus TaxID=66656 RepID=A0A6P5WG99_DURZI|nr:centromere protein C isoform X2 [Durio zibethinus]